MSSYHRIERRKKIYTMCHIQEKEFKSMHIPCGYWLLIHYLCILESFLLLVSRVCLRNKLSWIIQGISINPWYLDTHIEQHIHNVPHEIFSIKMKTIYMLIKCQMLDGKCVISSYVYKKKGDKSKNLISIIKQAKKVLSPSLKNKKKTSKNHRYWKKLSSKFVWMY